MWIVNTGSIKFDTSLRTVLRRGGVEKTMYTIDELAERWKLDRKTLYLMVSRGELPARRFGRAVRIPRSVVERIEHDDAALRRPQ
jgi:excisionase family DNA binding protein